MLYIFLCILIDWKGKKSEIGKGFIFLLCFWRVKFVDIDIKFYDVYIIYKKFWLWLVLGGGN